MGVAIKPGTTVVELAPWANQIDMALVMTVEPGFGGQKFMEEMMPKVRRGKQIHCFVGLRAPGGGRGGPTTSQLIVDI